MIRETFKPQENGVGLVTIDFHVLLSPTWQLPLLYFSPYWTEPSNPLSLREVYDFIVTNDSRNVLEEFGVMGGISHGVRIVQLPVLIVGPPFARSPLLLYPSLSD